MSDPGMGHWARELAAFRNHLRAGPATSYRSWQPAKWQSLESVRDRLLAACWDGRPGTSATALELGCGSATLLLQLADRGVRCTGIDRDEQALKLAREAAASVGVPAPDFIAGDFFDPGTMARLPHADLVLHIGVIEHLDAQRQMELLLTSARLSRRWVLIGIPHEQGPVFSSFLAAVTAAGQLYDEPHRDCDVPALVREAGYALEYADGLHVFYASPEYYTPGSAELDDLYLRLRDRLVTVGGDRYAAFPYLSFGEDDIPALRAVESSLTREERYASGFLRYYLVDTSADSITARAMDDPHGEFARLRAQGTVVHDLASRTHYVLGADPVRALSRDPRLRARGMPSGLAELPPGNQAVIRPVEEFLSRWLAFSDPPKQALLRRALAPCLTREVMAVELAGLAAVAVELAGRLAGRGGDLVADFAAPLSRYTTARVIGAEPVQMPVLAAASSALIDYLSAPGFDEARARLAGPAIDRLRGVVLGTLMPQGGRVAAAIGALRGDQVADDDLVAAFAQLLTGAMEPLTSAVVTATVAAARRHGAAPDRPDPEEIAELIEESLQMEPPFHFAPRVAAADLSVDGHRIDSGERVVLNLLHANDEIAARSGREHLSFGYGTHYCLGAAASRLHLQAALAAALDVGLPARLTIDRVVRRRGFGATAYVTAPVTR